MLSIVQREHLKHAMAYIKIAGGVKDFDIAYNHHAARIEHSFTTFLRAVRDKNSTAKIQKLKALLRSKNTTGATHMLSHEL